MCLGDFMKLDNILLYSSFLQLKGISRRKEEALWESGIDTLGALQNSRSSQQSLFSIVEDEITPYIEALVARKSDVFLKKLDSKDYYRVAYSFPEQNELRIKRMMNTITQPTK